MSAKPGHLSASPETVAAGGCDLAAAKCVAIMMHGRDRNTDDILQVADRLNLDHVAYLAPAAPDNSWYPGKFMEPLEKNQPWLDQSLAVIDNLVNAVKAKGFRETQILLVGFSQGACVVTEYVLRYPGRYGGIIIFTGGFNGPAGVERGFKGGFEGTPVFLGGSDVDEWIPEFRIHETAEIMKAMGAEVEVVIYKDMEHLINDDEIEKARRIFQSALNG